MVRSKLSVYTYHVRMDYVPGSDCTAQVASQEETGVRFSSQLTSYSKVYHAIFICYTTKKDTPLLTRDKSKRKN